MLMVSQVSCNAPVAQLDRVLPSEGRGRPFESGRAHHEFQAVLAGGATGTIGSAVVGGVIGNQVNN